MKKIGIYLIVFMSILIIPTFVKADEGDCEGCVLVSETIKYLKTETNYGDLMNPRSIIDTLNGNVSSVTTEISKEEYDAVDPNTPSIHRTRGSCVVETTYKKMTTQIYSHGSGYRYKNKLIWKIIPAVRSYDVIGIGFYASVRPASTPSFSQYYCNADGCTTSGIRTTQVFSNGASATFKLPTGTLSALDQTFYFDVEKNTNSTIISQVAAGDYAHATTSTILLNALNHEVIQTAGIQFDPSVSSYFDTIDEAITYWTGSW